MSGVNNAIVVNVDNKIQRNYISHAVDTRRIVYNSL